MREGSYIAEVDVTSIEWAPFIPAADLHCPYCSCNVSCELHAREARLAGTLERIKSLAAAGEVLLSQHAYDRLREHGISAADIEAGIAAAVEIEDYPEYHKGPSVLVLQQDGAGQPIHVLWGIRIGTTTPAVVVTAYRPDPSRWTADFRRRL